jgi:hypothetical protein
MQVRGRECCVWSGIQQIRSWKVMSGVGYRLASRWEYCVWSGYRLIRGKEYYVRSGIQADKRVGMFCQEWDKG